MSRATFSQIIGWRSVGLMSWPTVNVPKIKAADAEPRIQPYSKGLPAISGLAELTDKASAIEVVGASAAAWIRAIKRNSQIVSARTNEAAVPAANTAQVASTRRNDPKESASSPTNGPATRRMHNAAARIRPICWELKALDSKNLGQNGDETPNA